MEVHEYEIGIEKNEIETPALLVDLNALERNIQKMAEFCQRRGINLRPHAKIYKATPVFAWMQLNAGAIGLTVSKLSEAEVLANAGIKEILIANQVVGEQKVRRLVNLAAYTHVITAVDSLENLSQLSQAAQERGVELGVVVEVNIGNDRCGVEPLEKTAEFVHAMEKIPALKFRGLMGYDGHLVFERDFAERDRKSREAYQLLVETAECLRKEGIEVEIISGGGSTTCKAAAAVKGMTELQPGTYLFMDTTYKNNGLDEFDCTLTVLSTIISRPQRKGAEDVAILDVGRKAMDLTYGFPEVKYPQGTIFSVPQEHSRLRFEGKGPHLKIGDKVELWVKDANGTINLYDKIYAMRNDIVEAVWDISGRGKVT